MRSRRPATATATAVACLLAAGLAAAAPEVDVAQELERLMGQYGFQMKADQLESTREIKGRAEGTELVPRLNALLEGFNYAIVQGPQGVERVLILGAKTPYAGPPAGTGAKAGPLPPDQAPDQPTASGEIVLDSQRKGTSHALTLGLEGTNGQRIQRVLLLDTGADFVVLPASLIGLLGIQPGSLRAQRVQTANGAVDAQLGTLPAVWMSGQRVAEVAAAFIDDNKLGGSALLGMSVLTRFRVTIDDAQNKVVFSDK